MCVHVCVCVCMCVHVCVYEADLVNMLTHARYYYYTLCDAKFQHKAVRNVVYIGTHEQLTCTPLKMIFAVSMATTG